MRIENSKIPPSDQEMRYQYLLSASIIAVKA